MSRRARSEQEVTLLAVSKTKPGGYADGCLPCGSQRFRGDKVQELVDKIPQMPSDVRWHMIGHLQRNKVKYIVDKVYLTTAWTASGLRKRSAEKP